MICSSVLAYLLHLFNGTKASSSHIIEGPTLKVIQSSHKKDLNAIKRLARQSLTFKDSKLSIRPDAKCLVEKSRLPGGQEFEKK